MNYDTPMTVFWRIHLLKRLTTSNSYEELAERLGLEAAEDIRVITRNYASVNPLFAQKIIEAFPYVSRIWLLSGKGEPFL